MEDVEAIPSGRGVDDVVVDRELFEALEDGWCVAADEEVAPHDYHWVLGGGDGLGGGVLALEQLVQGAGGGAQVGVWVGEVSAITDHVDFGAVLPSCLQDSGVEHWGLCSWVHTDQQDSVSILNTLDPRVE